jgi:hypothetical protein
MIIRYWNKFNAYKKMREIANITQFLIALSIIINRKWKLEAKLIYVHVFFWFFCKYNIYYVSKSKNQ